MTDLLFVLAGYVIVASVVYASMELIETYTNNYWMTETKMAMSIGWIIALPIALVIGIIYYIGNKVAELVKMSFGYYAESITNHNIGTTVDEVDNVIEVKNFYRLDDGTVIKTVEKSGIGWFTINDKIKKRKSTDSGLAKWINNNQPIKESKKK
jgi:hypothetical protein